MFSRRTRWDTRTNVIESAVAEAGAKLRDLTVSNPTACGLPQLSAAQRAALAVPTVLNYRPDPRGLLSARVAVAAYYRERGYEVDPARIFLTASTSEAYAFVLRLIHNPGERMLVPAPSYPLFDFLAGLNDVALATYSLHFDDHWWIDVGSVAAQCGPETRSLVIVSPNNPTGSVTRRAAWDGIVDALGPERAVIWDEVFADYRLDAPDDTAPPPFTDPRILSFTLGGFSKTLGLPQMKLAWCIVGGPEAKAAEACARLELIADTYLSVAAPVQAAAPTWLAARRALQAPIQDRLRRNLDQLQHATGPFEVLPAEGGWSAVIRMPGDRNDAGRIIDLIRHARVRVDPGSHYGFARDGYLVLSLLTPEDIFAEGLTALIKQLGA